MYFSNSHESRDLPMPAMPGDRDELRLLLVGRAVEELLDEPQLAVTADERRLERRTSAARPARPRPREAPARAAPARTCP